MQDDQFDAFLSYRRRDATAIATWLRWRLQRALLPPEVVAELKPEARALYDRRPRIFLDTRSEKASGDFLEDKVFPALRASRRLIVISTPAAFDPIRGSDGSESPNWLMVETEYFLTRIQPPRPVYVVLGPRAPEDRFPGALNNNQRWDWADLRRFSWIRAAGFTDALDTAVVKLLAAIYDVPADLLPALHREEQRQRSKRMLIGTLLSLAVALIMSLLLFVAVTRQVEAKMSTAAASAATTAARQELARAQAREAGRLRSAGDPLAAIRLLSGARHVANDPLVTAQILATPRPPARYVGRISLDDSSRTWPMIALPEAGRFAVGHHDGTVTSVSGNRQDSVRTLLGEPGPPVVDLAVSHDRLSLFVLRRSPADAAWNSAHRPAGKSEIVVVDLTQAAPHRRMLPNEGEPGWLSIAPHPSGEYVLIGTDSDIRRRSLRSNSPETVLPGYTQGTPAATLSLAGQGRYAIATSITGEFHVWDLAEDRLLHRYQSARPPGMFAYSTSRPGTNPSSPEIAFGGFDGRVYYWRISSDQTPGRHLSVGAGALPSTDWGDD